MANTNIATMLASVQGTKLDYKHDWKEDAKADWKVDWVTGGTADTPPHNTVAVVIAGSLTHPATLTATPGTWTGSPTPVLSYQWANDNGNIPGATSVTYLTTAGDVGANLHVVETATNNEGGVSVSSNVLGPIV